MRTSDVWAPVIASLPETHWHGVNNPSGQEHPAQFKRLLANALTGKGQLPKVLSPAVVRRLQAVFSKLVRPHLQVLHLYNHKLSCLPLSMPSNRAGVDELRDYGMVAGAR